MKMLRPRQLAEEMTFVVAEDSVARLLHHQLARID